MSHIGTTEPTNAALYPASIAVMWALRGFAALCLFMSMGLASFSGKVGEKLNLPGGFIGIFVMLCGLVVTAGFLFASELLRLNIDIARSTRETANNTESTASPSLL